MKISNARLKNLQYFLLIKRLFAVHYYSLLYYYLLVDPRRDPFQSLQCISRIQMFGKTEIHNSNVWKSQNTEFQSLEKPQLRIPMFGKAKTLNSNVWKVKIQNSNVKKRQNPEF